MVTLYSGTPGSGKSYHAILTISRRFERGGGVISNFPVVVPQNIKPKKSFRFSYWDNSDITPEKLAAYARLYHVEGIEGQTLLVVDEAQVIWNSRSFTDRNRMGWVKFFSQHRKLGFDILVIAQNDRMLDKQMRMLIEYEVKHRKINNYGLGGVFFSLFGNFTWFIAIKYWYGGNKLCLDREMIRFQKKIGALYDSYKMFETDYSVGAESMHTAFVRNIQDTTSVYDRKGPIETVNKETSVEAESVSREIARNGAVAQCRVFRVKSLGVQLQRIWRVFRVKSLVAGSQLRPISGGNSQGTPKIDELLPDGRGEQEETSRDQIQNAPHREERASRPAQQAPWPPFQ